MREGRREGGRGLMGLRKGKRERKGKVSVS